MGLLPEIHNSTSGRLDDVFDEIVDGTEDVADATNDFVMWGMEDRQPDGSDGSEAVFFECGDSADPRSNSTCLTVEVWEVTIDLYG